MLRHSLSLLWALVLSLTAGQNEFCPQGCRCLPFTIRCINVQLQRIPANFIPRSTKILDLRYNNIQEIKAEDLYGLVNLERLYLGNNILRKIEPNAFSNQRKLQYLYLFSNKLQQIDEDTFKGLKKLEQLYLQNNGISDISSKAFTDLISLKRLYLHRNALRSMSKDVIAPMKSLSRLRLSANSIPCTCNFAHFVKKITLEGNIILTATCLHKDQEHQATTLKYSDLGCYKPRFLSELNRKVAVMGATIKLPCKGDGVPIPTTYWLKDGRPINEEVEHTIRKDGTLILTDFSEQSAGFYQCVIENAIGKNTIGATVGFVSDEVIPSFLETPTNVDAIVNSIALLTCRATAFPRPKISWVKNGQLLQNDGKFKVLASGDLEIQSLQLSDSGLYTCRAENKVGIVTHSASIVVKAPPTFTRTPSSQDILDGETTTFQCKASGYPTPAIAWLKDGSRLPSDGRHIVLPSGTLRILYARKTNEGVYECQAINVIGVIAVRANLTVRSRVKPYITEKPPDMTVQSGNTISFQCKAKGSPKPDIIWIRNDVQVTTGNRFTVNPASSSIEIKDIGNVDAGRWQCVARNNFGVASEVFSLTVIGPKNGDYKGDRFVLESLEKAKNEVDRAIELTKQKLRNFEPKSPADLLALFRFPSPDAIKIARSAEIFEIALELIQKSVDSGILHEGMKQNYHFNGLVSPQHIRLLANLSGCTAHRRLVNCSDLCFHLKYRTFDGSCNNFNHPMWGTALTPFSRLLVPNYENGFNTPVGWNETITNLPSPREISLGIMSSKSVTSDDVYTHMLMQWGQFLDHDMDFTVTSPSTTRFNDGTSCRESCENQQPCFPIKIPKNDPRIKRYKCMEFTRSSAVCGSGSTSVFFDSVTPRQQINQITSFIDASNVYGSGVKDATELRSFDNEEGLLKQGIHYRNGKFLLPFNQDTPIDCQVNQTESRIPCFLAGDHRANEHLGLLSMHTLWMRQHNHLAKELRALNPQWNGDRLYQEARKIVGAQMQHITYTEWLPKILGKAGLKKLGNYHGYNPNTEPMIFNSFATAAFRFGHSLVQPFLARLNETFEETAEGNLPLHKAFFSPYRLVEEGGIDPLLRGLFGVAVKDRTKTDQVFNSELTERLFEMAHAVALDLAALNIQRGRDHGLPTYNRWRQFCNMSVAKDFEGFHEIKNRRIRRKLKELYGNVDNVDLIVGGMLEETVPGSRLGPLFTCLITLQFKRLREGDRFWYENPGVFTAQQLIQIKQTTLSRIICDNSDKIRHVQSDVFRRVTRQSEYVSCGKHPNVDLRFWKECCTTNKECSPADSHNTLSNFIRNGDPARRSSRKRRAVAKFDVVTPSMNVSIPSGNDASHKVKGKYRDGNEKQTWKNTDSKMRKRIKDMERKISKFQFLLNDLQEELTELRRVLKTNKVSGKVEQGRHCIDEAVVKEHGDSWFDEMKRKCTCQHSRITCS